MPRPRPRPLTPIAVACPNPPYLKILKKKSEKGVYRGLSRTRPRNRPRCVGVGASSRHERSFGGDYQLIRERLRAVRERRWAGRARLDGKGILATSQYPVAIPSQPPHARRSKPCANGSAAVMRSPHSSHAIFALAPATNRRMFGSSAPADSLFEIVNPLRLAIPLV